MVYHIMFLFGTILFSFNFMFLIGIYLDKVTSVKNSKHSTGNMSKEELSYWIIFTLIGLIMMIYPFYSK
jgi:hypothetical protein